MVGWGGALNLSKTRKRCQQSKNITKHEDVRCFVFGVTSWQYKPPEAPGDETLAYILYFRLREIDQNVGFEISRLRRYTLKLTKHIPSALTF